MNIFNKSNPGKKMTNFIFSESDPGKMSPPVQMPLLPPGLQQMQQLLQANIANILFQANIKENVLFQANVQIYQELTLTNRTLFKITQSNMLTNYFQVTIICCWCQVRKFKHLSSTK